MHLRPCPSCARHVRADETSCPFCQSALDVDTTPRPTVSPRLGRAARIAFGAAVATASIAAACGNSPPPKTGGADPNADEAGVGAAEAAVAPTTTTTVAPVSTEVPVAKPYGAPPAAGLQRELV